MPPGAEYRYGRPCDWCEHILSSLNQFVQIYVDAGALELAREL